MRADELDYVIGVDSHRDADALAVVAAGTGAALFEAEVAASAVGYGRALRLAGCHAPGRRAWAIEGTGSDGAGLARFLAARGERLLEIGRSRRERRSHAKTDALDALRAARGVLATTKHASPRAGGRREALPALMVARAGALTAKKAGASASSAACSSPARSRCAANSARSRRRSSCAALPPAARTGTQTRNCAAQ